MTDWAPRSQTFHGDDKSWLASAMFVDKGLPVELDLALFDTVTNFPNGFLPSGILVAKRASDNRWGHYNSTTHRAESVSLKVDATSGNFTLTFESQTTANIAFNATAAAVQAALETLADIDPGDILVTGGPGNAGGTTPYVITWAGRYADQDVPPVTATSVSLAGGAATVVPTTTAGGALLAAGLEVARGHLLFPVSTVDEFLRQLTTGAPTASVLSRGRVRLAKLPANSGIDAAAQLALPLIEYV